MLERMKEGGKRMNFSEGELLVMELLWDGECLDENGEIKAIELSHLMTEKYGISKSSNYTFINRLLEKRAITRRYPKYTLKPIITRKEVAVSRTEAITEELFNGSFVKLFSAFISGKKASKQERDEVRRIIAEVEEGELQE